MLQRDLILVIIQKSGIETGVNKKVIGKFKDEAVGKQITHLIGLNFTVIK